MKIVFLARYLPAEGSTTHMYSVAKNFIERGHKVYILSKGPSNDPSAINLFEKAKINGVSFVKLRFPLYKKNNFLSKVKQLFSYIFATPFALFQLFKIKPDIIHAHYPVTTYLAATYRFLTGKKFIITHHTMGIPKHILNRKADYVIAISREVKEYLLSFYKYKENQVILIFNGVSVNKFSPDKNSNLELKELYDIPLDSIVFGFVGTVSRQKGIDVLIKAFNHCKHLKIHLIVLGNGNIKWLNNLLDENQINKMITLIPFRDPKDIYSMIDVLILPSRIEGFGLVSIEAMMMGKPAIRSNVAGSYDQIIDGINGYLFESENYLQLANIIEKITLNPKSLINLGESAHDHAVNNFSEDLMIDKMLELYAMTN